MTKDNAQGNTSEIENLFSVAEEGSPNETDNATTGQGGEQADENNGSAGASGNESTSGQAASSGAGQSQQSAQVSPQGGQQSATSSPSLSAEQIAEILKTQVGAPIAQLVQQQQQAATAKNQKQWTQEDFDRAFNVVKPTVEQVEALKMGGEAALRAMTELLHGAARQGATMAHYRTQQAQEELTKLLNPLQSYVQEQRIRELETKFYAEHKDLEPYKAVVKVLTDDVISKQMKFKTEKEAFDFVSNAVRTHLKSIPGLNFGQAAQGGNGQNGNGQAASAANGQNTSQRTARMSTLSSGGQGGVGGASRNGKGTAKGPAGIEVF